MISVVIPALPEHEDEAQRSIETLAANAEKFGIGQIILAINHRNVSPSVTETISAGLHVTRVAIPRQGLGHSYHEAIAHAHGADYLLLTASDLPFGTSDLENFASEINKRTHPEILVGSKWHPQSVLPGYPLSRRALSKVFQIIRFLCFPSSTILDSQGTILVSRRLAEQMSARCVSRGFFYTTELLIRASRENPIIELPIVLSPSQNRGRGSSLRLVRDGVVMFAELIRLRLLS